MRATMLLLIAGIAAAALVASVAASAAPARYSRGDAEAVLNAFGSGGWAIRNHSPTVMGAPAGIPGEVAIKPIAGSPFDGAHYCALDWHTIVIAHFEDGPLQAAEAMIDSYPISLILDGTPQVLTQTPVKRFLADGGSANVFYRQWGRILAPSDMAPGTHTLGLVVTDTTGAVVETDGITFSVDPDGQGACL
jgi:hypothetical protein